MNLVKIMYKFKKITKHMQKNEKLREHMDEWLEQEFKIIDEQSLLMYLQKNPNELKKIVEHYESIKGEYK